ncbi:LysR family transcriptional regulator [Aureimonas sp. AU40]|uniref:LysR family transcriptional regulator n=1 Tax=Aureimonas sp. AU40 TaxID=1637747 RepID=UPI0009EA2930|nr:LysR family transcriptional regulator [Aureimonas sp. AU40]
MAQLEIDLNLLTALDALLREESVTGAAARLGLSVSATSRLLARLRVATGDPLLVRAGRRLVPTPHALALRAEVPELARDLRRVLSPEPARFDTADLQRTFVIRANDGFVDLFAAALIEAAELAPGVCLRFAPKPDKDVGVLRDGRIDLEIGVLGASAPEMRFQHLFRDRFVGVVRAGHPLLEGTMDPQRFAACRHVVTSRKAAPVGPIDDELAKLHLRRKIAAVVSSHRDALAIAAGSDLVASVPSLCLSDIGSPHAGSRKDVVSFPLPVPTPGIAVSLQWHPRMDADPAHRWLRTLVKTTCTVAPTIQCDPGSSAVGKEHDRSASR